MAREIEKRTTEEKKEYLRIHFGYELSMLRYSLNRIRKHWSYKHDSMALEDFLVHARNLIEFFYHESIHSDPRPTDVRASDFVSNNQQLLNKSPGRNDHQYLEDTRIRAGREIAHFTTKRESGPPKRKNWECGTILAALSRVITVFFDNLPQKYMCEELEKPREYYRKTANLTSAKPVCHTMATDDSPIHRW